MGDGSKTGGTIQNEEQARKPASAGQRVEWLIASARALASVPRRQFAGLGGEAVLKFMRLDDHPTRTASLVSRLSRAQAFDSCLARASQLGLTIRESVANERLVVVRSNRSGKRWAALIVGWLLYVVPGLLVMALWKATDSCELAFADEGPATRVTGRFSRDQGLVLFSDVTAPVASAIALTPDQASSLPASGSAGATVVLFCTGCGAGIVAAADRPAYDCSECGSHVDLCGYPGCGNLTQIAGDTPGDRLTCPKCKRAIRRSKWRAKPRSAAELSQVQAIPPDAKPNLTRRVVAGQVIAATGFPLLSEGTPCEIQFSTNVAFVVELVTGTTVAKLAYDEITDLRIGGAGRTTVTKGGGWIGGGFGVEGAIEGALFAGAMNKLTTRSSTSVDTRVELQAGGRALWVAHRKVTPAILQVRLTPVLNIVAARSRGT